MNTHELARELLSHRANDVRIEVLVDKSPEDEDFYDYVSKRVELRDSKDAIPLQIPSNEVVFYETESDMVIIRAGIVYCPLHEYPK